MERPTKYATHVLEQHGPCIVAQVRNTNPGTVVVLTWDRKCIWVYDGELRTFPTRESGSIRIPDLRVKGASEICDLFVDIIECEGNRRHRARSPLMPLFNKIERDGEL